jgi:hypothetical protein
MVIYSTYKGITIHTTEFTTLLIVRRLWEDSFQVIALFSGNPLVYFFDRGFQWLFFANYPTINCESPYYVLPWNSQFTVEFFAKQNRWKTLSNKTTYGLPENKAISRKIASNRRRTIR